MSQRSMSARASSVVTQPNRLSSRSSSTTTSRWPSRTPNGTSANLDQRPIRNGNVAGAISGSLLGRVVEGERHDRGTDATAPALDRPLHLEGGSEGLMARLDARDGDVLL